MTEEQNKAKEQERVENDKTAKMAGAGAGVLAGAQVGTILLPIPVVGTFTGALVGGLIGTKIGKKVGGALLDKMSTAEKSYSEQHANSDKTNVAKELQRLAELREAGILSEEEFKAAKAKLLGL